VLALDIPSSRNLSNIVDTLVPLFTDLDKLLRLRLNLFVDKVDRLQKWIQLTQRERIYLMLCHSLNDSNALNR
jgi:hypothetical protein